MQQMAWNSERCDTMLGSPLFPTLCVSYWPSHISTVRQFKLWSTDCNVKSPFIPQMTKKAREQMLRKRGDKIINFLSLN